MTANSDSDPNLPPNPWPSPPNWRFAAFCIVVMMLAVFLVWLVNWLEVREIRQRNANSSSPAAATAPARNP